MRARLLALAVSTAVAILVLEVVARVVGLQGDYPEARIDLVMTRSGTSPERPPHGFVPFSIVRSSYSSDPRGYFAEGNRVDHHHNSVGWRDREHSVAKPAGIFRILGLGDSYLWGQGVKDGDTSSVRLEAALAERVPGTAIEVINAGLSTYHTETERDLLFEKGLAYQPDLVILHYVPNDVEVDVYHPGPKVEFFREYTATYQEPGWLSRRSQFIGWAAQRFGLAVSSRSYIRQAVASFDEDSEGWQRSRAALDDIARALSERDIGFLVVLHPFLHELDGAYPFQPIHDALRRHCESTGVAFLDLRPAYRDFNGPELWVHPTDQHPNELAHRIAADTIADHLLAHPELFSPLRRALAEPAR